MPVDPLELRLAMRNWATGVTIVSVVYQGVQHGMTVSSFTSVSLNPPTVMISLERISRTHEMLVQSGYFGVTILTNRQQEISDRFAGRETEFSDRFAGLTTFTLASGVPFIEGGLAFFDCRLVASHLSGTNTLFLGEVIAIQPGEQGEPLLYFNRRYNRLRKLRLQERRMQE
jgi:flavin reductase (DIM6/NTAB) family NADH-FMN oxidoreductase RutF